MKKAHWVLVGIIVFALLIRLPGVFWGVPTLDGFQVDETQHVGIALNLINQFDSAVAPNKLTSDQWNARAMGIQIALLGYPLLKSGVGFFYLYGVSRLVSLIYGILTVLLVYLIVKRLTGKETPSLISAALMAIFDLHATYSHMGVPVVPYIFWSYLAIYLTSIFIRDKKHNTWILLGISLSTAMALSMRFYIVVPVVVLAALIYHIKKHELDISRYSQLLTLFAVLVAGFFYLSVGFDYNLGDALQSKEILQDENQDVVAKDDHWLLNPFLYLIAIIAGTSLPVFAWFLWSFGQVKTRDKGLFWLLTSLASLAFILFWVGDATFVRRAAIFLPYVAVICGIGIASLKMRRTHWVLISVILIYTLGLTLVSQWQFVDETRYDASEFINDNYPDASIAYSYYARTSDMPTGVLLTEMETPADVLVMHEARYGRYWKYFTTPFKVPKCCEEVYHCSYDECIFTQNVLSGNSPYDQTAVFSHKEIFLERWLFKKHFGTYETMLGDVRIFERKVT